MELILWTFGYVAGEGEGEGLLWLYKKRVTRLATLFVFVCFNKRPLLKSLHEILDF